MARLPVPGSDNNTWGDVLNDFLVQSHKSDGSLKDGVVTNAAMIDGSIQELKLSSSVQTKLNSGIASSEKAAANGVATLDSNIKLPASQMRPFNNRGPIAANTTYNPWDAVIYRGRRIVVTNQFSTGSAPITFVSAANYYALQPEARFYAADYGSLTGSDAQVAINAAMQDAYNMTTGAEIVLPEGIFAINAPIEVLWGCTLVGAGKMSTIITLSDNSNCEMIRTHISTGSGNANAAFTSIRDLGLNGRKASQAGSACHGIILQTNPATTAQTGTSGNHQEWFDPHHAVENVAIRSCLGNGLHMIGRSASHIRNVWTDSCDGYGIYGTFDTTFIHCEAQQSGLSGFYFANGSIRALGCKSYLNGRLDHVGAGFEVTSNGNFASMVGCDAQNNRGSGYQVNGARSVNINGTADANGLIESGSSPAAAVSLVNANGAIINVGAINSPQNGSTIGNQNYGLYMTGCTKSVVIMTNSAIAPATIAGDLDPTSNLTGQNDVTINGISLTNQYSLLTDVTVTSPVDGQVPIYNGSTGKWVNGTPGISSAFAVGIFGDGSDGSPSLDGTTPTMPSGAYLSRSGSTYTLIRDVNAGSTFTVKSGSTLLTSGYKILCLGTITIESGATVSAVGNDGNANGTAGAVSGNGSLIGSLAGGAGNVTNGSAGSSGTTAARHGVGAGGAGGTGASGTAGAGTFNTYSTSVFLRSVHVGITSVVPYNAQITMLSGGPGGGGGGGDGTNKGGGGGAGGGAIVMIARSFTHAGTLSVKGGNGGTPTIGNCGGGGGGAGGLILIYTLTAWTNTGTVTVTGGTAGSGVGTGTTGVNGTNGTATNVIVQ